MDNTHFIAMELVRGASLVPAAGQQHDAGHDYRGELFLSPHISSSLEMFFAESGPDCSPCAGLKSFASGRG